MIRRAIDADAERIAALSDVLGYPVTSVIMAERLARLLARPMEAVFVAEDESRDVIGWIHASHQELLESGPRCEIAGLVVAASWRGRGVGRELVSAAERWAADLGLDAVTVRSNVARVESHPFYERLGYRRVKTQHAYRKLLS